MRKLHAVEALRQQRMRESKRPFLARGSLMKRCPQCQVGALHCICSELESSVCQCDLVLLMHSDEPLKPTNTGRIIAETLPDNLHAFIWSRTQPSPKLLKLIAEPDRQCLLIFPERENDNRPRLDATAARIARETQWSGKKLTLILLDATWKQARKMYSKSDYLAAIPALTLNEQDITATDTKRYGLRKAHATSLSSTCEAAAVTLNSIGETSVAQLMLKNFEIFNRAYLASRMNLLPDPSNSKTE